LRAPFVWFGGKSKVAPIVWEALGDVEHYVEPFFGSGAVLLSRPHPAKCETINDADGLLANFWRAVAADPELVAEWAANPVNEADLHARHLWLVNAKDGISERLMADPDWHDAKAAGWWVWGINCWIGGGFCSGDGPWVNDGGVFTKRGTGQGVNRQLPHLGGTGQGVNRKLPHLGGTGQGVNRKQFLLDWFGELRARLHDARVACGDWSRVCGPSVLRSAGGVTGVFLDPPYDLNMRAAVYANESGCAADVRKWCAQVGGQKDLRIVLAGYDGEHNELEALGWRVHAWKAVGGFGNQSDTTGRENSAKERLWFSPHCLDHERQGVLL
jgi:DNA adenine methylase